MPISNDNGKNKNKKRVIIVRDLPIGVDCFIRGEAPSVLQFFPYRPLARYKALNAELAQRFLTIVTGYLDEGAEFHDYEPCGLYLRKTLASDVIEQFEQKYNLHLPTPEEKAAKLAKDQQDLFG